MTNLKKALRKNLDNYLQDWDKDDGFRKQCDDLADQLEKTVLDVIKPRYIPDASICFYKDGDKWTCVNGDFVNLQESPAGFGDSFEEALDDLRRVRNQRYPGP